jgi:hypothetical protein
LVAAKVAGVSGRPTHAEVTATVESNPNATRAIDPAATPPHRQPFEQLPARRGNGVTDQLENPWLFPRQSRRPPHHPQRLGMRLRALGIEPRAIRSAARAQLAAEIPPAMLGEIIGVSAATATRWAIHTSANWNAYAAVRSPL